MKKIISAIVLSLAFLVPNLAQAETPVAGSNTAVSVKSNAPASETAASKKHKHHHHKKHKGTETAATTH